MTRTPNFSDRAIAEVRRQIDQWASWAAGSHSPDAETWMRQAGDARRASPPTATPIDRDERVSRVDSALRDLGVVHPAAQRVVLVEYLQTGRTQDDRAKLAEYSLARYRTLLEMGTLYIAGRLSAANRTSKLEVL